MSTYPERCDLAIERRTLPGESTEKAMLEIMDACARVKARRARLRRAGYIEYRQLPSEVPPEAPIVRRLREALERENVPVTIEGISAWTDAALLNEAGIPAICFGPGDISPGPCGRGVRSGGGNWCRDASAHARRPGLVRDDLKSRW